MNIKLLVKEYKKLGRIYKLNYIIVYNLFYLSILFLLTSLKTKYINIVIYRLTN